MTSVSPLPAEVPQAHIARNRLALRINYLLLAVATPWIFIFWGLGQIRLSLIAIPVVLTLICCWGLYKIKQHHIAKIGMVLCTDLAVFFYASSLGKESGIQWVYFGLVAVIFVLFDLSKWTTAIFGIGLPLLSLGLLEWSDYSWFQSVELAPLQLQFVYAAIVTMAVVMAGLATYFYFGMFTETITQLQTAYLDLQASKNSLQKAYYDLKTSRDIQMKMAEQVAYALVLQEVAHEIKNPLFQMKLRMEIAEADEKASEESRELAVAVHRYVDHLESVIRPMLENASERAGRRMDFSVQQLLVDFYNVGRSSGVHKRITLTVQRDRDIMAYADKTQVFQSILNLIANAVEHTPDNGQITVTVGEGLYQDPRGHSRDGVRIDVADTGEGIPPEHLDTIFQPFVSTHRNNQTWDWGWPWCSD